MTTRGRKPKKSWTDPRTGEVFDLNEPRRWRLADRMAEAREWEKKRKRKRKAKRKKEERKELYRNAMRRCQSYFNKTGEIPRNPECKSFMTEDQYKEYIRRQLKQRNREAKEFSRQEAEYEKEQEMKKKRWAELEAQQDERFQKLEVQHTTVQ